MTPLRAVMLLSAAATLSGAWWLAVNGVFGETTTLDRSIRSGSPGNTLNASVK